MKSVAPILQQFFVLFFIVCAGLVTAQSVFPYEAKSVARDVYVLKPLISDYRWVTANIVIIVNDDDVLVVDSGLLPDAATEAIKEIRKITSKPVRYLVNTHWHGDHWQGNEVFAKTFPGIQIIATEQTQLAMKENGMVWSKMLYLKHFGNYISSYEKAIADKKLAGNLLSEVEIASLKIATEQFKQDVEGIKRLKPILPNITFSDRLILTMGDREIQVLYLGIGNTSGDAIVFLPKERVLIAGDLVVHPSPYESGMFSSEWLETSRKMASMEFDILIPGHGDVQQDKLYLNFLNALYSEIIKQIKQAYTNSGISTADELKKVVTHKSVVDELMNVEGFRRYIEKLDTGFVPAAIQTSFKRVIQGKK